MSENPPSPENQSRPQSSSPPGDNAPVDPPQRHTSPQRVDPASTERERQRRIHEHQQNILSRTDLYPQSAFGRPGPVTYGEATVVAHTQSTTTTPIVSNPPNPVYHHQPQSVARYYPAPHHQAQIFQVTQMQALQHAQQLAQVHAQGGPSRRTASSNGDQMDLDSEEEADDDNSQAAQGGRALPLALPFQPTDLVVNEGLIFTPQEGDMGLHLLSDSAPGEKPNYPYPVIVKCAILGSPRQRLTLSEIYTAIENRFPYFRQAGKAWRNSVRHNLSLNKNFIKVERPITEPGKGSYWMVNSENGNKRERKRGSKKKGSPSQQSNTNTMQTPEPTTTTNTHIPQPSSSRGVTSANMGSGEAAPRTSFDSERHTPAPSSTHYSSSEEAEDGSQNGGADRSRRTHSPAYHPYAGASSSRGRPWTANMNPEPIARFGESGFQFIQQGPQPGASESRPRSGSDSRYTSSRPQEDDRDRRKPAQQNGAQPFSRHASDGHDIRRRDSPPPAHTRERSRDMNADQHSHARGHSQSTSASPQNRPRSPPSDEDRTARPRPVQRIGSGTGSSYIPRKPPSSKFGPWAVNTARGIPPGDPRHPSNQGPPQRAPITDTRPREDVKGKGRAIESDDDDDQD